MDKNKEEWAEVIEMRKHSIERDCVPMRPELLDNASVDDSTATVMEIVRTWLRVITGGER